MGRSVEDAHLLLKAQIGDNRHDPFAGRDADSIPDRLEEVDLSSLRLAWSVDLGCSTIASDIRRIFGERMNVIRSAFGDTFERNPVDAEVHESFEILRAVNFVAAHRERLEKHRDMLGPNVIDNTERGMGYSLADVAWAHTVQTRLMDAYVDLFREADILICPAAAVSPFPHADLSVTEIEGRKMETYMRWLAPVYALTSSLPSVCVIPCGLDDHGMPFGIQIAGPKGSDRKVMEIAHSLQRFLQARPETARPEPDLEKLAQASRA